MVRMNPEESAIVSKIRLAESSGRPLTFSDLVDTLKDSMSEERIRSNLVMLYDKKMVRQYTDGDGKRVLVTVGL